MSVGQKASPLGAMEDLVVLAGLSGCPLVLAKGLKELGWNVQRLGTLGDQDEELIATALRSLEERLGMPVDPQPLLGLIEVAAKAAEISWRVEARTSDAELLVIHHQKKLQDKMNEWRAIAQEGLNLAVPEKGKAPVARWPTRLAKRLNSAGQDQRLREKAEKDERSRWIRALRNQLLDGRCPVMRDGALGRHISRRFGKGRRASTLRKHVKTWEKLSQWMLGTFRHPWPTTPEQFCAYLECRADEPCGKTIPNSIFKTLMFMENAGEIKAEDQVCRSAAVRNVLEEVNLQLAGQGGGFTKRAWHMPVRLVVALEAVVMEVTVDPYARIYAWFRLVKLWTGMRFSDTLGLSEKSVEFQESGLTAILLRTKTSGPGKKVIHLRIWVNMACWLRKRYWLETGFDLWKKMGKEAGLDDRDFGLPCPSGDMQGFAKRVASYAIASKCSQALFNEMKVTFEGAMVPLLAESCGLLWSEHSERATMRTWAEGAGVSEETRRLMGRWVPTTDQAYERAGRLRVLRAQANIASFVKDRIGGPDPFDESLIFAALSEKMTMLGYPLGAIELQIEKLTAFQNIEFGKRPRLDRDGELRDDQSERSDGSWQRVDEERGLNAEARMPVLEDADEVDEEDEPLQQGPSVVEMPTHGTYILSVVGRSQRKTLHRMGECHRLPGVHYHKFEIVGEEPPLESEFHQTCQICFPRGAGLDAEDSEESDAEDLSSSDSSSSVEDSDEETEARSSGRAR